MKLLAFLIAILQSSCIQGPSMTEYNPQTGTTIHYNAGTNVMGQRKNAVTHIKGPGGREIINIVEDEDAAEVPNTLIAGWVTRGLAWITGRSADLKTVTDGNVAITQSNNGVKTAADAFNAGNVGKALDKLPAENVPAPPLKSP